jgi:two-component sensor histidine kinase
MVRDAVVETAGVDRAGIWLYDEKAGGMRGAWGTDRDGKAVDESGEFFPLNQPPDHPLQQLFRGELSYYLTPEYQFARFPTHGINMSGVRAHATLALRACDKLIGMLFVDSLLTDREIEESDLVSLIPFCEQAALAIDSARLREAERDKAERLANAVRETNHRVKNNLQIVAALLDMQLMESGATIKKGELQRLVGQIRAIASVHDFLSHGRPDLDVNVKQVLEKLLPMIAVSNSAECTLTCDPYMLPVKQGTALALVINELVSNAAKHGASQVSVEYTARQGCCRLIVGDNGPGFPAGFDIDKDGQLGLDLVRTLARWDLQGTIACENSPDRGARVKVEFCRRESLREFDGWESP